MESYRIYLYSKQLKNHVCGTLYSPTVLQCLNITYFYLKFRRNVATTSQNEKKHKPVNSKLKKKLKIILEQFFFYMATLINAILLPFFLKFNFFCFS